MREILLDRLSQGPRDPRWPPALAAIDTSNGSVTNSGSMSAPGIWLGVSK
jgi:hypothetical protein